jgi:hypothetical protein
MYEFISSGVPMLFTRTTITFIVVARNDHSPVCTVDSDRMTWSVKENTPHGTIVGTLSCHDDDYDEPNGHMSVQTHWSSDDDNYSETIGIVPFEIKTITSNTTEV